MVVTDEDIEDFLAHHGVKGMKWGVRKERRAQAKAIKKQAKAAEKENYKAVMEKVRSGQGYTVSRADYKRASAYEQKQLAKAYAASIAVTAGIAFVSSVNWRQAYSNASLSAVTKINAARAARGSPVDRAIKDIIRKGPPPSTFMDVANRVVPKGREIQLFRG